MRPLTEDEASTFFEKLTKYIGKNIKYLIDRQDEKYVFRLHKDRVYYLSENVLKTATLVSRKQLVGMGTCFGKFSRKGDEFKLHITALEYLAQFATHKIWIKPTAEMNFVYGNHILKAHLARITEDTPKYQGVVIFNMNDLPLGFGLTAVSTNEARKVDSGVVVAFNQADVGEYLRNEEMI